MFHIQISKNYKAAYNLKKLKEKNIKNVVIICDNIETPFENVGIKYFSIPIKDRELEEEYFINGIEVNEYLQPFTICSIQDVMAPVM